MTLSAMLQSRMCNHVALTSQYVTQILRTTDICHTVTYSAPFSVLPFSLFSRKSLNSFLFHFKSSFFFSPLFAIPVLIAMHPSLLFSVHPNYLPRTCTCECPVPTKKNFSIAVVAKTIFMACLLSTHFLRALTSYKHRKGSLCCHSLDNCLYCQRFDRLLLDLPIYGRRWSFPIGQGRSL